MNYQDFIASKQDYGIDSGFDPLWIPDSLFDFQVYLTEWAIRKGRAAIFTDCGTGKTLMQLVWAQNMLQYTNKPGLILTPLAVGSQTLEEAQKFGIEACRAAIGTNPKTIQVTNYEQLHHFDPVDYGWIVADESSILKNYNGKRRRAITEFMRTIPYRLLATATAAPNDWTELGTSSEALGYFGHRDMLTKFFTRKQVHALHARKLQNGFKEWRIKSWAAQGPFWQWIASWAKAARKPSDLGFDDDGFILPPLIEKDTLVKALNPSPGRLFDMPAVGFHECREAMRRTITERCEMAAEKVQSNGGISMVWCNLNKEGDLLEILIPGSVQIAGKDSDAKKEEAAHWFRHSTDKKRVLISKAKIFGFGMNFQHCNHMTYFPDDSYEKYYQASRRLWRFGQSNPVTVDRIYTDGGGRMMQNLQRKAKDADKMFDELVRYMGKELHVKNTYIKREVVIPQWMK